MRSFSIILHDTISATILKILRLKKIYLPLNFTYLMKLVVICVSRDKVTLAMKAENTNMQQTNAFANIYVFR